MRQKQMEEELIKMKAEYGQIPVSEEALLRIKAGIAQGKYEAGQKTETGKIYPFQERNGSEKKRGKGMKIIKNSGMTAAAALLAITVLTNVNPTIANAMEQIPVIGPIAKVVTFRTYENQTNQFEADIQVPQIAQEGTDPAKLAANKSIDEYAAQMIEMYEKNLAAANGQGHYSLESDYEVVADTDQYLSIKINTTLTMAGGTQFVKVFTVDKSTGQVVTLKQALANDPARLQAVTDNIKAQMESQMQADPDKAYFLHSDIPDNDFAGITGEESYYRDKDGNLVILFDEYEVAPGYMGAVEFTVPAQVAFPGK